ncbi:DUF6946 family protein [Pseudodesulfovibrio hydrargyri]|nr:hypothetical protein [Pseudodesulfovibrio hydrargyri]
MKKLSSFYVPSKGPDDWRQFLADPVKQWKTGYSAKELAYSWEMSKGFPAEIQAVLNTQSVFQNLEILFAVPEYQVSLPGGSRPSQNDLFVMARNDDELVVIMIEGKAYESFGPTLGEWRANGSEGKLRRLAYLQEVLQLDGVLADEVRYQLLHRTASPLIVAEQFHATSAIMLVHSFSEENEWFNDYSAFLDLYGVQAQMGVLQEAFRGSNVKLYCGWAKGVSKVMSIEGEK